MSVRVVERYAGTDVWYVWINWRNRQKRKKVDSRDDAERLAVKIRELLDLADILGIEGDDIELALQQAAQAQGGVTAPSQPPKLGDYYLTWLEDNTGGSDSWKKSTQQGYQSIYELHIKPYFADWRLDEIKRRPVKDWLQELRSGQQGKPLSRKTLVNIYRTLSSMLTAAADDGLIERNPIMRMRKVFPKVSKDRQPPKVYTDSQLQRLLRAARAIDRIRFGPILFMARTGVRVGEALGVQPGDLDLVDGTALIQRQISRGEQTSTKNRGFRTVELTPDLVEEIRWIKLQRKRDTLRRGWTQEPPFLFYSRNGRPVDADNLRKRFWRKVIDEAEVPDHGFHGLRHTWISNMLVGGANPFRVSRAAGHSSFNITVDVYGHLIPNAKRLLDEVESPAAR